MLWHLLPLPQARHGRRSAKAWAWKVVLCSQNRLTKGSCGSPQDEATKYILKPLIDSIHWYGSHADRCIVFVCTYEQCEELFLYAAEQLGVCNALYVNLSEKNMPRSLRRTCDMFTGCTASSVKKNIIQSFTNPSSNLRLLIATTAFLTKDGHPNKERYK